MEKKRKELTEGERNQIVGAWKSGVKASHIIKTLKFPKSTVYDTITFFKKTGEIKPSSRPGLPPKLTERDFRHLVRLLKEDRKSTLNVLTNKFIESTSTEACTRTIQRYLHEKGFYSRVGKRKPFINEKNSKIRFKWAQERLDWEEEWKFVVWSDESRFEVFGGDGRTYVWRKPKEKYDAECLIPTFKSGRKGTMVWGCFCLYGLGPLVRINGKQTANDYINVLQNYLLPYLGGLDDQNNYLFQDDSAPIHRARVTLHWLSENNIDQLSWPAQSPDLNPIEHLWDELERRVRKRIPLPKNETELFDLLQEEWLKLDESIYQNLVESMSRRVHAVVEAKGYPTRY
jgi:transposase